MITPIELAIFDCDGVLVDSERIAVRVYVAPGAELGRPPTGAEVIEKFIGRSIVSNCEHITSRVGLSRAALRQERFGQLHRATVHAELTPVDGILEVLDTLALPICVASGGRRGPGGPHGRHARPWPRRRTHIRATARWTEHRGPR